MVGKMETRGLSVQQGDLWASGFTSGISPDLLDETACRKFIIMRLHPSGVVCPECGADDLPEDAARNLHSGKRVRCPECGYRFSALSGTVLSGMRLRFADLVFMLLMFSAGYPVNETAAKLGCNPTTVRAWMRKLRNE